MTVPATPALAAVRFLNQGAPAADLAETGLVGGDALFPLWIWEDNLQALVENSQKVAIVVSLSSYWSQPAASNTWDFPRLQVDIWADPDRNTDASLKTQNSKAKIFAVHNVLRKYLHNVDSEVNYWDGFRILSSKCTGDPVFHPIADGNGGFMGTVYYNLATG